MNPMKREDKIMQCRLRRRGDVKVHLSNTKSMLCTQHGLPTSEIKLSDGVIHSRISLYII